MLLLLFEYYREFFQNTLHFYAMDEVLLRSSLALLTSLLTSLWLGPRVIRWLVKKKVGDMPEFNHASLNELTRHKTDTPTMGGVIILAGIFVGALLWADIRNQFVIKGLFLLIWLGALGGVDDWLKLTAKIKSRSRDGLHSWEKLLFQIGLAVLMAVFLYQVDFKEIEDGHKLWIPFYKYGISLSFWGFLAISVLVITGSSNAINLTDGMDGLATGCIVIASMVLVILCFLASESLFVSLEKGLKITWAEYLRLPGIPGAGELGVVCAAMMGACLGFLWFNCHPAQVFMGDMGSLPMGGLIGYVMVVTRHELLLVVVGGVFVLETASVIIQVWYYKYTGGKRVFLCAPIHHHFHLKGWSEPQVVIRLWLMGIAFAAMALATLKLR
ncbi:MAG: phospho-N-acetylmuramoyl-pentapeptide-transferase [Phycisphaerae bacterium]|nr:phospho-N-acetylmuramoyl-pentapeptide-transferase [Phycisphaerae bacterium]